MRLAAFVLFVAGCAGSSPAGKPTTEAPVAWTASTPDGARDVRIDATESFREATTAILGDACVDAVLVWGDVAVEPALEAKPVAIDVGGTRVLAGYLVCGAHMEDFLRLQTRNPRLKAGHGGSADLKWRDGQLWLRRRWSAVDVALGQLAPPPSDVFQRGETLAAIVSCEDAAAPAARVLPAIARAPRVFLFAMLPLR